MYLKNSYQWDFYIINDIWIHMIVRYMFDPYKSDKALLAFICFNVGLRKLVLKKNWEKSDIKINKHVNKYKNIYFNDK